MRVTRILGLNRNTLFIGLPHLCILIIGWLVVKWVTTSEPQLLHIFLVSIINLNKVIFFRLYMLKYLLKGCSPGLGQLFMH